MKVLRTSANLIGELIRPQLFALVVHDNKDKLCMHHLVLVVSLRKLMMMRNFEQVAPLASPSGCC